jgi:hypothetical protein
MYSSPYAQLPCNEYVSWSARIFLTFLPMYLKEVSDRLHITAALPAGKEPAALTALES